MNGTKTGNRKKIVVVFCTIFLGMMVLAGRLVYLMVFKSEYYGGKAQSLHQRERDIKAARGKILDINGNVLASNRSVCTISVIHSQIEDGEKIIRVLSRELEMEEETVRKRVETYSAIERIKSNVSKETGDRIREYKLAGVKVDEDYKRYYPYDDLASKVLGFTGGDNQGIIGLEVVYDEKLKGTNGKILTLTDAKGVEIEDAGESRLDPVDGSNLRISLDYNLQMYAQQAAEKAIQAKEADSVSILIMNPSNGQIMTMVNLPEFNLNEPYGLPEGSTYASSEEKQELLNQMWRNGCINDTYEPGSTFKVITASAALEAGVVSLNDNFFCPGRVTKLWKTAESAVPEPAAMVRKVLWKGWKIPAIRSLSNWVCVWGWSSFTNISVSSACLQKPVLICLERHARSCMNKKMWARWNLPQFLLDSLSRLRRYSLPLPFRR